MKYIALIALFLIGTTVGAAGIYTAISVNGSNLSHSYFTDNDIEVFRFEDGNRVCYTVTNSYLTNNPTTISCVIDYTK